jgi:hypothetical protein
MTSGKVIQRPLVLFVSDIAPINAGASAVVLRRHLTSIEQDGFDICVVVPDRSDLRNLLPASWTVIPIPARKFYFPPYRPVTPLQTVRWLLLDAIVRKNLGGRTPVCVVSLLTGEYLAVYAGWLSKKFDVSLLYFYHDRGERLHFWKNQLGAERLRRSNLKLLRHNLVKRVWTVSEELIYPGADVRDKFRLVFPFPEYISVEKKSQAKEIAGPLCIAHIGTIYTETLDSFRSILDSLREFGGRLIIYSQYSESAQILHNEFPDVVDFRGFVDKSALLYDQILEECHAFLVVYPDNVEDMPWCLDCFPSKFVQLVQTGLPGLVVAPSETSVAKWCEINSWSLFRTSSERMSIKSAFLSLQEQHLWRLAAKESRSAAQRDFNPTLIESSVLEDVRASAISEPSSLPSPDLRTQEGSSMGRLAYKLYHEPIGKIRTSWREGGPIEQYRTSSGQKAMRAAAATLPPLREPPAGPPAEIAFLSGERFWDQTLFCFVSLQLVCPFRIDPVVFDDGTLGPAVQEAMRRAVPWIRFVTADQIRERLDARMPEAEFPSLRAHRLVYPHLRKLTDIHIAADKFTLVADSDMLFFREPAELLGWFAQPRPIYMQDVETAYGYPLPYLDALAGAKVPEPVNVGLYGLDSASIDWKRVEHWCESQLREHGRRYLQEQALTAMLFARIDAQALPREDYIVKPDPAEGMNPIAALHHYVDVSKHSYFRHGWRRVLANLERHGSF